MKILFFAALALATFSVPANAYVTNSIDLGQLAPGRYILSLASRPGPQSVQQTLGTPDARSVSIRLREPVAVLSGR